MDRFDNVGKNETSAALYLTLDERLPSSCSSFYCLLCLWMILSPQTFVSIPTNPWYNSMHLASLPPMQALQCFAKFIEWNLLAYNVDCTYSNSASGNNWRKQYCRECGKLYRIILFWRYIRQIDTYFVCIVLNAFSYMIRFSRSTLFVRFWTDFSHVPTHIHVCRANKDLLFLRLFRWCVLFSAFPFNAFPYLIIIWP